MHLTVAAYVYDADGSRLSQTVPNGTPGGAMTTYLVDATLPFASVVQETDPQGNVTGYTYGDDLLRMERASGVYYYLDDGLGSTRALADASGVVTDTYVYDAFGSLVASSGKTPNTFLFNGQQFDGNLGLYYLRARYYAPTVGKVPVPRPIRGKQRRPSQPAPLPVRQWRPGGSF